jgi:hypothetical protein
MSNDLAKFIVFVSLSYQINIVNIIKSVVSFDYLFQIFNLGEKKILN